jgi:hypothetical protein
MSSKNLRAKFIALDVEYDTTVLVGYSLEQARQHMRDEEEVIAILRISPEGRITVPIKSREDLEDLDTDPDVVTPTEGLVKANVGFCCFAWDDTKISSKFGTMRLFLPMTSIFTDNDLLSVELANAGNFNLDKVLAAGDYVPCLSWAPMSIRRNKADGYGGPGKDETWNDAGTSGLLPAHYAKAAKLVWQFVARYGSTKHDASLLKTNTVAPWNGAEATEPKSGLDLIKFVEVENEPNRWWKQDPADKYTPEQWAVFQFAMFVAVKNADPNMKVVMSGLSFMDEEYLTRAAKVWKDNGYSRLPFDVINVHHYCNQGNKELRVELTKAWSPVEDNFEARCKRFVAFCRGLGWKQPIWLTEAGYDNNESGMVPFSPQATTSTNAWLWNEQIVTIAIEAGFEKVHLYKLFDLGSVGLFQASGLYTANGTLKNASFGSFFNDLK